MSSMDTVFNCVIPYIQNGDDRNSVSLVCRKWNEIDCFTRKHVTVHLCYAPTPSRVSKRFPYLESLTLKGIKNSDTSIDLTQWIQEIAIKFTCLKSLRFRHLVIRDSDLKLLAKNRGKDLLSLKVCKCKGFSENGLMCVAKYFSELKELCLEEIDLVVGEEEVEEHGKWLRVLALRKTGIEKFSYMNNAVTTFGQEDVVFLLEKCRESLVSLRVDSCLIDYAAQAISNAVNLQDFFGAIFYEDEQYVGFKFPLSIRSLGLSDLRRGSFDFVDPLLNQLRELSCRWIDVPQGCQCLLLDSCPNLEVLHTEDVCGNLGLNLISQFCKKLRKLTVYSRYPVGLMAVAQGCPNLEYLHVELTDILNEDLECIGSNLKNLRVFHIRVIDIHDEEDVEEYNTILPLDNGIRTMLIGCTKLERLSIHLYDEDLTDVGLGFIGKYGINLRFLSLAYLGAYTGVSDEGLRALSMGCPRLRKLEMQGCDFSGQAIASFLYNVHSLRYFWVLDDDCVVILALTRPNFGSSTMEAQGEMKTIQDVVNDKKIPHKTYRHIAGVGRVADPRFCTREEFEEMQRKHALELEEHKNAFKQFADFFKQFVDFFNRQQVNPASQFHIPELNTPRVFPGSIYTPGGPSSAPSAPSSSRGANIPTFYSENSPIVRVDEDDGGRPEDDSGRDGNSEYDDVSDDVSDFGIDD